MVGVVSVYDAVIVGLSTLPPTMCDMAEYMYLEKDRDAYTTMLMMQP